MAIQNPPPTQPPMQPPPAQSGESNDRLWAALSYVFTPLVPIIVLAMDDTKHSHLLLLWCSMFGHLSQPYRTKRC